MITANKSKTGYPILLGLLLLSACQPAKDPMTKHQLWVFGTVVDITIWHHNPQQTEQAINTISATFNGMHNQWHAWKPGRLDNINQALRKGQKIRITAEEAAFIQQTMEQARLSNHLFNPVIGELINLWGFHTDDYPLLSSPPDLSDIQALVDLQLNVDHLELKPFEISGHNQRLWLDLGGIAKGYAVDRAIDILQSQGINNAIINTGGDLRSIGDKGDDPWRIAIQSPVDWTMVAELAIVQDEAVFTSGNYQRYKEFDGQRYAHIIDPRTGFPVDEVVSATVISDTGIQTDAAATALVVAGSHDWFKTAKRMGITQALIINDQLECYGTQAMISRLENLTIPCEAIDQ